MKPTTKEILNAALGMLLAFLVTALVFLCLVCGGCTKRIYVPVESVRTEYKDRVQLQTRIDSVFQRDSISVFVKGDTVKIDRWHDRVKWRDREVYDTIVQLRRDSVSVPYPVEKELSKWEQTKMELGGIAMGAVIALAVALCIAVVWIVKRRK